MFASRCLVLFSTALAFLAASCESTRQDVPASINLNGRSFAAGGDPVPLGESKQTRRDFTNDAVYGIVEVDEPPVVVTGPAPLLSAEVEAAAGGSTFLVELIITSEGLVDSLTMLESEYPEADAMILDALSRWIFRPAQREGQPVWARTRQYFVLPEA